MTINQICPSFWLKVDKRLFQGVYRTGWNQIKRPLASEVTAINMAYKTYAPQVAGNGENSPLVIMHGVLGSSDNWNYISRSMSEQHPRRIYAVDARNHGASPHVPEHTSRHLAEDVVALMRSENLEKICAAGHSMGGRCMMTLALWYPELVERLVVVDISPISIPDNVGTVRHALDFMKDLQVPNELTLGRGRQYARKKLFEISTNKYAAELITKNLLKNNETGEFYWAVNVDALTSEANRDDLKNYLSTLEGLSPYEGPVLFIAGSGSRFFDESDIFEIRKHLFPHAELSWLDTGHLVHYDDPEGFIKLLLSFLS